LEVGDHSSIGFFKERHNSSEQQNAVYAHRGKWLQGTATVEPL
jgi:hypothetical protein